MGSEKYPDENEYTEYIKNNGGFDNAFTDNTKTNYHFTVSNEGFEGALDRFAQFFICPNFSENSTEQEMKAVDSEYNMSLLNDHWRTESIMCKNANPGSAFAKFMFGNLESLKKEGVRQNLLDFH